MKRIVLVVLWLAACSRSTGTQKTQEATRPCAGQASHAFVDVTVVPMDSVTLQPARTVLVCGGRIAAVGPVGTVPLEPDTQVVVGKGRFLMPGLADMHVHLVRPEDLLLYLARGVTTVRNMWGTPMHLEWRDAIASGTRRGPTIYTAGPIVDGAPPVHDGSLVVTTEDEADRVVSMHQRMGYDFIKVYTGLSAALFGRIQEQARAAHLTVAGHVPRAVGVLPAVTAGMECMEHLAGWVDALQKDDSPVKGTWEEGAWEKKPFHVDEARIPELARVMKERGVWNVPTRVVKDEMGPPDVTRRVLASDSARYVPPSERAIWEMGLQRSPDGAAANTRYLELHDRMMQALHAAGARVLVGTDPGNPLVVPGFSVLDEIKHFVRVGYSPFEALRAATRDAAESLHAPGEFGGVAAGMRADLLLLDGNPLEDVDTLSRPVGVMARGHWMDGAALASLLTEVEASVSPTRVPFEGLSPLPGPGTPEFLATYGVTWRGLPFGAERLRVDAAANGARTVTAQSVDPHTGQTVTLALEGGGTGVGSRMVMDSDGAAGRGHVEVTRGANTVNVRGQGLAGQDINVEQALPSDAVLGGFQFLAQRVLLTRALLKLGAGKEMKTSWAEVALGSTAQVRSVETTVSRVPGAEGAFVFKDARGRQNTLTLDANGWPLRWEIQAFGSLVVFTRL